MKEQLRAIQATLQRMSIEIVGTRSELNALSSYVHSRLVTRDEFHERMDAFSGKVEDMKLHAAQQKERLDDLEARSRKS